MSQSLKAIFGELGISQYLDAFLEQGFDTWETILDITESDLDALGVKLGHRRKLQRRIANSRGIAPDASLVSPTQAAIEDLKLQDGIHPEPPAAEGRETVGTVVTKRKYRRHPKPDENAPERPPSAYVLFSNKMREELKGRNLSFAEIAKLVGENWQNLSAAEKEPFEARAQAIKDKYLADLAEYKKTPQYSQYQAYLREFNAKHGSPSQDKDASKRVRLSGHGGQGRGSPGAITTRTSRSGSGANSRRGSPPTSARQRISSVISSDSQYTSSLAPSTSITSPEDSAFSPTESNPDQQHAMNRSPPIKLEPKEQSPLLSPRHASQRDDQGREQSSMHRHLPSLSDLFDGQGLPGTMRQPSDPSGYRFPGAHITGSPGRPLGHRGADARSPPMTNGTEHRYSDDSSSSHPPFGLPRPSVDGPLPIHALLDSMPEPTFRSHQPAPLQPPNTHLATEQNHNPSPVHQSPSSGSGRQIINGTFVFLFSRSIEIVYSVTELGAQRLPSPSLGVAPLALSLFYQRVSN
ncbi:hypothetical protein MYCTH_2294934 [Thermothelomyces thermophilus ATCC 42464]|uniref:HMG box domain-containing protein n=1 Tax=Thermothelomyces thermophilus (strain ATCC 42464 / BCRC 31852 / DSM 1799) TaxID=573729 RepID=G2Q348_THET4|nr:uncharacterized protein MYCTH_2294934 [Thermothelomyces thermophilus ATCC 42464]AEO53511.1 hypothetical protein MYCTH_2294934 [Thermothelomyces thermophilus ATCC 42464]